MPKTLRVIDFGPVSPLRSQTTYHAIAYGVSAGAPPTLSFARPTASYVCLGYHRSLSEVDRDYCRASGLEILRRMVGGGPVYLDPDQLFFQICLPAASVPASRSQATRRYLEPAVASFRALGVPAALDEDLEICVGDQKICGHGAGQIEDAVVVCGNLIERFDHRRATRVLALSDPSQRAQTLALMRRFVAATPVDPEDFKEAMITSYADALGLSALPGALNGCEREALVGLDESFASQTWLAGPPRPSPREDSRPRPCQVKVRAGVFTFAASCNGAHVVAGVVKGMIELVALRDRDLNGSRTEAERAVTGVALGSVEPALARFGEPGRRLAAAFARAQPGRL
ncbi:MAG: hypothetical protein ABSG36_11065 [Acidimicrobiales bacterium]